MKITVTNDGKKNQWSWKAYSYAHSLTGSGESEAQARHDLRLKLQTMDEELEAAIDENINALKTLGEW